MTSSTVAQHATQPLNFGPEWLRALSTPDSATSIPSSSGSGNVFKFSTTKYRYSKDEILALRVNVSERLSESIKNEVIENLKNVESVFRETIIDPLVLTAPTSEETAKMNALSSYISGRTPGGAGRTGHNPQQESRANRGSSSSTNARGGSRGRGGREHAFSSNRASNNNNNNSDDNGDSANPGDDTNVSGSSSWSRNSYHSRGASFGNRIRSFDEREQSQTNRRGSSRQTSEGWRRSRGDDVDNSQQGEDSSTSVNGSTSWSSRSGQTKRGGSSGSMEHRTKSNEKWNSNDDRSGSQSSSYEASQQRSGPWRTNSSTSDRDLSSRRPQLKQDSLPEWMDDNDEDDDDNNLCNATFEQDGTFTRLSSNRQNDSDEQQKPQSQTVCDELTSQNDSDVLQPKEEPYPEKISFKVDTNSTNAPVSSETVASQPTLETQQLLSSWNDDDFDHDDVATTVVESTLAEDYDYSPPVSAQPKSRLVSTEPTTSTVPIIPQQQTPVIIDDKQWFYKDPQNTVQGPFSSADMERWFVAGYFTVNLPVKRLGETSFSTIQQLAKELGRLPFRTDVPSVPSTTVHKQQSMVAETQKLNAMPYAAASASSLNNALIDDYLMQQSQSRQNLQHSSMFNRQTSMPVSLNDRKPVSSSSSSSNIASQLQSYLHSQQPSTTSSSLFSSSSINDPAIIYQQQLHRSVSSSNQQQTNTMSFSDLQRSYHHMPSQPVSTNNSSYFSSNMPLPQQQSNDLMTRLSQAMQTRSKQQQEKFDEQRRFEQQRRELEHDRLRFYQAEQIRLQREEEGRRQYEQQEIRIKQELNNNRQFIYDQLAKAMENKKQSTMEMDPFLVMQQSIQYQKEQQAKLEAQQAENVRRYQEKYREQLQPNMYAVPETAANWSRQQSQTNDLTQSRSFADIQKQEQERRSLEASAFAHQYAKSQTLPIQNPASSSSQLSSTSKTGSWAQTLFAGSNSGNSNASLTPSHILSDHDTLENSLLEPSSVTVYTQHATNAPKSRPITKQQSPSWNAPNNNVYNTSLQDMLRQQQAQSEVQQQSHHMTAGPSSTAAWANNVQQSSSLWPNQPTSSSKASTPNVNKPSTSWTELKPTSSTITSEKVNLASNELLNTEHKTNCAVNATCVQNALLEWIPAQFKDGLKDVDVPTLVQLLKDIDNAGDIIEYVQPFIGTVSKAKEFANRFILKRDQLIKAEPCSGNELLDELTMAPISTNDNNDDDNDEGFQLASSNGQKKKVKKIERSKFGQ